MAIYQVTPNACDVLLIKSNNITKNKFPLKLWLDTTTPQGKLLFTIFAGLSQFERDLIAERTRDGLVSAKKRGKKLGRPNKFNDKKKQFYKCIIQMIIL